KPAAQPAKKIEDHRAWTAEEKENLGHFFRAVRRQDDADSLYFFGLTAKWKQTPERFAAMKAAHLEAQEEATLVKPKGLARPHPHLPRMFREVFLKELNYRGAGLAPTRELAEAARELRNKRLEWWEEHRFDLDIPDDVPMWDAKHTDIVGPTDPQVLKD